MKLNKTRKLSRANRLRELLLVSAVDFFSALYRRPMHASRKSRSLALRRRMAARPSAPSGPMSSSPAPHSARSIRATS